MKVKDIMTRSLIRTKTGYTINDICRFLLKHHLNSMPVVDNDRKILGIITKADIFRAILPSYDEIYCETCAMDFEQIEERAHRAAQRKVEDVMTSPVITVTEDTPVVKVGSMMLLKGIKQIPVVKNEKLIGMVTLTDVIEGLIISTPKTIEAKR
ncbi:MAG: CBS domain-containing protein [Thermodesulfobacteriota bacterium]|nr:CBS domain-containing protein [Thermodesulfobacteriota bacterium]